jgi:hypothetical protein
MGMDLLQLEQTVEEQKQEAFDMKQVEDWINEPNDLDNNFIMLIYGVDGTAKTGILLDYLHSQKKRTLYLDVDGNAKALFKRFHKEANDYIKLKNPLLTKVVMKQGLPDVVIDYKATFARIKLAIKYAADHPGMYDALVIDGLSTLLDYAAEQMKMEKNIAADGTVNLNYWKSRKAKFLDVLEQVRSIEKCDKFFIGHEDFINIPGTTKVKMGSEIVNLSKTSAPVLKTNRMMDQRVYMELQLNEVTKETEYTATIHKWREDGSRVNSVVPFAKAITKEGDRQMIWNHDAVMSIFNGGRVDDSGSEEE